MTEQTQDMYEGVSLQSPADRDKLKAMIDEAVMCKKRAKLETDAVSDYRKEAKDALGIPPKIFNRVVKAVFKDEITTEKNDFDDVETILETLYPNHV